jgi:hypothetical protein
MQRGAPETKAQACKDLGPLLQEDLAQRIDWAWLQACPRHLSVQALLRMPCCSSTSITRAPEASMAPCSAGHSPRAPVGRRHKGDTRGGLRRWPAAGALQLL